MKIISPVFLKIIFCMLCEQHVGLSEESYRLLKKALNWTYWASNFSCKSVWKLQSALQNLRSKESIIIFSVASETPAIIWAIILNKYSHLWQGFKRNVHVCARVGSLRNNIYVLCKKYSSYCSNHRKMSEIRQRPSCSVYLSMLGENHYR